MNDVVRYLQTRCDDWRFATKPGVDAIPHLLDLVSSGDVRLACKAARLAGYMPEEDALDVLRMAARSMNTTVRITAADAVKEKDICDACDVIEILLEDSDLAVRQVVLESVAKMRKSRLKEKLETLSEKGGAIIRKRAKKALRRI